MIDFPRAVDPRMNAAACALLERDVDTICHWAASPEKIALAVDVNLLILLLLSE